MNKPLPAPEVVALPRSAAVHPNAPLPDLSSADLSNVVRFARPWTGREAPEIAPPEAARVPEGHRLREHIHLLAFAAISLALHGGALWALWREPTPLASIGEEVISVEIVVGAAAPAGVAPTPGEAGTQAAAPEPAKPEPPREEAAQAATTQPQQVPVAAEEKAPDAKHTEQSEEKVAEASNPEEEKPRETSRDTEATLVAPPERKAAEPKRAPKPAEHAKPATEPRRIDAPSKQHAQKQAKAAHSTAANNVGVGRSDNDSNYAGLVSAHLRRHQRYPEDARSRHEQGTATVTFGLDSGGRVTSARLVRGSGIVSIDREVQAMVHRASPFPPPPSRHPVSFTVPVTFRLN